ncbi:hypothetical protein IIO_02700 [Bacillus cereus VD115]|nr:hypothetical protein IIO_02700 [Bacillus cereus VD115]
MSAIHINYDNEEAYKYISVMPIIKASGWEKLRIIYLRDIQGRKDFDVIRIELHFLYSELFEMKIDRWFDRYSAKK